MMKLAIFGSWGFGGVTARFGDVHPQIWTLSREIPEPPFFGEHYV